MECPDCCRNGDFGSVAVVGAVAVGVIALITMLGCGIAGAVGKLPMAPVGARLLIGLPVAVIVGAIAGVLEACVRN